MIRSLTKSAAALMIGVMLMSLFTGCFAKRYSVDYSGQKESYLHAKDSYRAGEKVEIFFDRIATDTDYSFYLDKERLSPLYDDKKGFVITFTMPAHDVVLEYRSRNSMIVEPEETLLVEYRYGVVGTDGGDNSRALTLTRLADGTLRLDVCGSDADGAETFASYSVPEEAAEKCYEIINEHDFRHWDELEDPECIDGVAVSCRFLDENGEYVRVSTDEMPGGGEAMLSEIEIALRSYAND